ncbi:hypothetical protein Trydic_g72 [Trypoxylus dichotomus]
MVWGIANARCRSINQKTSLNCWLRPCCTMWHPLTRVNAVHSAVSGGGSSNSSIGAKMRRERDRTNAGETWKRRRKIVIRGSIRASNVECKRSIIGFDVVRGVC